MRCFFFTLLLFSLIACNKNNESDLRIQGRVADSRNNSGLGNVEVTLEEQVLADGVLNASFQQAAQVSTASDGSYELVFERKNALVYRVEYERNGYFDRTIEINPDDVRPGEPVTRNLAMVPEAFFEVRLWNTGGNGMESELRFRNLDGNFGCACCTTDWVVIDGTTADTSFTCALHGDFMMHFTYEIMQPGFDTTIVDSVFCPAFQTSAVTIEW